MTISLVITGSDGEWQRSPKTRVRIQCHAADSAVASRPSRG